MGYSSPWLDWLSNNDNNKDSYTVYHLGTFTIPVDCGTVVTNNKIYLDGEKIPNPPCELNNTTIINNKIYVDGYEYKNGTWKKTLAAWWHKYF